MVSVPEMKAQAGAIKTRLEEANALVAQAIDIIAAERQSAGRMLAESGQDAANAALTRMGDAESSCDDVIANNLAAMEQLDTYQAGL